MLSICILAKNSERTIPATLSSLTRFPEVILLDTGSTDNTIAIASQFPNVVVRKTHFSSFGPLRNQAAALASHNWILALDSDEVLSPALQQEILGLSLQTGSVYEFEFHNFYRGKRVYGCGWHPERHVRLYNRGETRFSEKAVHEGLECNHLKIVRLNHPIYHTPYQSISDFLAKMQHYSDLFVKEHQGKRRSSFSTALLHGTAAFFKSYLLKRGIFCGSNGFLISFYNASTAFYKYLKLSEANHSKSQTERGS